MYKKIANVTSNYTLIQNSQYLKLFKIATNNSNFLSESEVKGVICEINTNFGEFGIYDVYVNEKDCNVQIVKQPVNIYIRKLLSYHLIKQSLYVMNITDYFTIIYYTRFIYRNKHKKILYK